MNEDMIVDLDLNQEPLDTPVVSGVESFMSEFETNHVRIEDRIRQLEAVTARARARQRWRQARNSNETNDVSVDGMINLGDNQEIGSERGKNGKRDSSHLVAQALAMDSEVKKSSSGGGSFYDCNICLEMAREPILTCCGHLFCWACFYRVSYVDSTAKECPVCKGEVTDAGITPIYGNGNGNDPLVAEPEAGSGSGSSVTVIVPPRPRARRVESVRQQRVSRGVSHVPVAEALRRIRIGIGTNGAHPQPRDLVDVNVDPDSTFSEALLNATAAGGSRRFRSRQLSTISSALTNAERLVEGLLRRTDSQYLTVDYRELEVVDAMTEMNSTLRLSSSLRGSGTSEDVEASLMVGHSSPSSSPSSRRRSGVSRVPDAENGASREPRRRRLR